MRTRKNRRNKKQNSFLKNKKLVLILKFLILLNIFAIPLYAILFSGAQWHELKAFTADASYFLIQSTGLNPEKAGLIISIPVNNGKWAANIDWDCTAWKSMLAFFALAMSTGFAAGFSTKKKLFSLIFIPIIYFVNIIRIWFMFLFVKAYDMAYFEAVHTVVWSWGLIFAVIIFWLVWIKYIRL